MKVRIPHTQEPQQPRNDLHGGRQYYPSSVRQPLEEQTLHYRAKTGPTSISVDYRGVEPREGAVHVEVSSSRARRTREVDNYGFGF